MNKYRHMSFTVAVALFFTGLTLLFALPVTTVAQTPERSSMLRQLSNEIAATVDKAMPSVVVVRTEAIDYHLARGYYDGNLYRVPRALAGQGSGVIIDSQGRVLTSYHVVENADRIEVVLSDEKKYEAELVGYDSNTDIAVLQIDAGEDAEFDPIESADSDGLRVGEIVIAVGSPFSLSGSVTMGIVSQKGRSVGLLPYEDFIQTDASINPGNSGGPLVNVEGDMVGLNSVIQTGSPYMRGNIGIGFAIPVNLAMRVARAIIEEGAFRRPWIGVMPAERAADEEDLPGVLIGRVFRNSPAEKAGLLPGDTVLKVNQLVVDDITELQKAVILRSFDEDITLTLSRGGSKLTAKIRPEPMPTPRTRGLELP